MRLRGLLAVVILLGVDVGLAAGSSAAAPARDACGPSLISHRGNIGRQPELTLRGYRQVLRSGIRKLEADVRFTRDGVPVLMHDPTVDRTTDGGGAIAAMPMWRVGQLDAGNGARVPRMSGLVRLARRWGADLTLEIKPTATRAQARTFLRIVREQRMVRSTLVHSFRAENLDLVQQMAPRVVTGLIFMDPPPMSVARAGGPVVFPHQDISTRRLVRRWHGAGFDVVSWTANRRPRWRALASAHVDAVMTDAPGAYQTWVRRGCR